MQIQITRTLIWVTNDARYYLATSACKLERQALSIWPFQIQRVRRRHYRPHGCATPPRYLFQRLKSNFTRESWNIGVKHIEDACPSQRNEKVFPKQWSLRVHQSENKSRQLFMFLFGKEIWQKFVSQLNSVNQWKDTISQNAPIRGEGKKRKAVTVLTPGWTQPPKSHGKLLVQPIRMQCFIFLITLLVSTCTHEFWNHSI